MPCRVHVRSDRRSNYPSNLTESRGVARGDFPPAFQITVESLQLFDPERTSEVGQTVVEAKQHHLVVPLPRVLPLARITRYAVIAKTTQRFCQPGIVGRDHTAFSGRDVLDWMKAKGIEVGQCPHRATVITPTDSMAGIADQGQAMTITVHTNAGDRNGEIRL